MDVQVSEVTWGGVFGLLQLPGLIVAIWKTNVSRESIRHAIRTISMSIVWLSLVSAAVDITHATGDLLRRIVVPGGDFRLGGVTLHTHLLAFTAAIALFLTVRPRGRFWFLHVLAYLAIFVLAEVRTLTVGLAVAGAEYWIANAKNHGWSGRSKHRF